MINLYLSMHIDTKEDILEILDSSFNHYKHHDKSSAFPCIPFHQAVEARNLGIVKELLRRGVDVNRYDHRGLTPLHIACMPPNKQGMKELINIYIKDKIGYAHKAVHTAFHNRNVYIFKSILIDYFKKEYTSNIVEIREIETEIVRLLLEHGADVNKKDKNTDSTALHFIADNKDTRIMEFLILYGAEVNIPDRCDNYPLHKAVSKSNSKGVEILLKNGAYTDVKSLCGNTPLHISSGNIVSYEILKMLLEHGACVNVKSSILGLSALHIAIRDEQKTKLLLEYKADVNTVNDDKDTPISVAVKKYSGYNICKLLITNLCLQEYINKDVRNLEGFKINTECIYNNNVLREIKDKCILELESLKSINITNKYTATDLLKENSPILDRLVYNQKIYTIPFDNFEIYGNLLKCNISNAEDRSLLIMGAIESIDNMFYYEEQSPFWNYIPLEIKHKIISLLDNDSLCNVIAK
ncbi:ankyrin repeat containing protein [Finch poxvirus]|uniref:Ankyrin repeat containing protein n=1 Tax=Condorpox virus TaxID=3049970 RepID=A0AAT9UQG7_9POXV|nr:ankyrin repeat containing protein [Finch poxvirus]UOX38885.1 ankyrin repeat containing protein [Finch poxvirus]